MRAKAKTKKPHLIPRPSPLSPLVLASLLTPFWPWPRLLPCPSPTPCPCARGGATLRYPALSCATELPTIHLARHSIFPRTRLACVLVLALVLSLALASPRRTIQRQPRPARNKPPTRGGASTYPLKDKEPRVSANEGIIYPPRHPFHLTTLIHTLLNSNTTRHDCPSLIDP